ncbi:MAG: DNA polymerase Y family protein [Proteobacteria bacterium]|nr:DNA polymerase Y family protein [Pseudomonadota bacterium]
MFDPPDAVLLEIGGSRALFGDWPDIQRRLRAQLTELGWCARMAAAPTLAAARVLADLADGYAVRDREHLDRVLARVPLAAARLGAQHTQDLHRIGVRRLGEAFVLPRDGLARRFGADLLLAIDRLRGLQPDPRPRYRPPDRFERRIDFAHGIVHSDALRFPLQRLTRELAAFLAARDGGVQRFVLRWFHDPHEHAAILADATPAHAAHAGTASPDDAISTLAIGLRKPSRDAAVLCEAATQALARIALPAPAHALALLAEDLPAFAPERRDLFDPGLRGTLDWDGLAERLRARLGQACVRQLRLHADHRPERQIPEDAEQNNRPHPAGQNRVDIANTDRRNELPPRPLWLLPRPIPLRGRVVCLRAPCERIESGWWDGEDIRRDYAIADLAGGQRAWLFRVLAAHAPSSTPATAAQGWMLHGWFA